MKDYKEFSRQPRFMPDFPDGEIEIQNPPQAATKNETSLLLTLLPSLVMVAMTGVIASMTRSLYTLISIAMTAATVLTTILGAVSRNKKFKNDEKNRKEKYLAYINDIRSELSIAKNVQTTSMNETNPSPQECIDRIRNTDSKLWEKTPAHNDFLSLRVGVGSVPFAMKFKWDQKISIMDEDILRLEPGKIVKEYERITGVPVTLDVFNGEVCGVAGEDDKTSYLLQLLLLQIITNHGYDDVKVVFLAKDANASQRMWVRFAPHIWSDDKKSRYLLCGKGMAHRTLNELYEIIKEREVVDQDNNAGAIINALPHYVFIVEEPQLLENEAITKYLYNPSKQYGVSTIFIAPNKEYLPSNCKKIVSVLGKTCEISDKETGEKSIFTPDAVNLADIEMAARRLAAIKIKNSSASFALPESITLNETYSIKKVEEIDLISNWNNNKTFKGMRVPIGARAGKELFYLDMHEKGHGPHGLVAGTTGSGKSELLQSIIVSLAMNYHPHDIAFVLIDYKGGGMADVFENMPHLAGTITNLGGNQTVRALISIKSEILRRQKIFSEYGVNNIDKYQKLYHNNKAEQPIPHLILIADEFAELKAEQPDFMKELVSAARVGRSLGIHLILATQKPAGVVDDQIWSNSKFKICLKVQDAMDSRDVIKRPDASLIKEPGRAYIQVGNDEIFEMFQSSFSGADYDPDKDAQMKKDKGNIYKLSLDGKQEKIYPLYIEADEKSNGKTQLEAMIEHISKTAEQAGIEGVDGLWLPPLKEEITLSDVIKPEEMINFETGEYGSKATYTPAAGIVDDPAGQEQRSLAFDFVKDGNLFAYGMSGSGKTVFLKSLCLSLALTHSPEDVNIYVLDMGGTAFNRMADIPHIGDVVGVEDEVKLNQFMHFMRRNIEARKNAFQDAFVDTYDEYVKKNIGKMPAIIIVIDNYYALSESYELIDEQMMTFAREGNKYGVYLVATATNASLIRYRFSVNFKMAVTFALTDKGEYSSIVGRCGMLEPQDNPGRGLVKDTTPLEFQAADSRLYNMQLDEIVDAFRTLVEKGVLKEAQKIPQMPEIVDIYAINRNASATGINVGFRDVDMKPAQYDIFSNHIMLVAGPAQTGKSTMVTSFAKLLLENGAKVYAKDSSEMGIYPLLSDPEVVDLDEYSLDDFANEIENELQVRRDAIVSAKKNGEDIQNVIDSWQQIVLVFDDIIEAVDGMSLRIKDLLARIAKKENGMKVCIIASGSVDDLYSSFDSALKPIKEAQSGILLGSLKEQSLFNARINYSDYEKEMGYCDGYMITRGKYVSIRAGIDKSLL